MGCGFSHRTELELRLNEFVGFLYVTGAADTKYTEQIRASYNNNIDSKLFERLVYYLSSRSNVNNAYIQDIVNLQAYVRTLSLQDQIKLSFSLLFLTRSTPESLK